MRKKSFKLSNTYLILSLLLPLFIACNSRNEAEQDNTEQKVVDEVFGKSKTVKINNKLFGIPSPFLTANRGKTYKAKFNRVLINPVEKQRTYFTQFKQAINLGIYGADVSYMTIYNQLSDVEAYIAAIKLLSEEIGIGNAVDEKTISRIEQNTQNRDSLMFLIADLFKNSDTFLFKSSRTELGVLILSGGWIESLYFITQTLKYDENQDILNLVGEQKQPLNNLIELISPYYKQVSTDYDKLITELTELASIFDQVKFEYQYKQSKFDTIHKKTEVNSIRTCKITKEQLKEVTQKIEKMRNGYVK